MKGIMRLVLLTAIAALAAGGTSAQRAEAAPAKPAGLLSCVDNPEYPFLAWGDSAPYTLAPNGSFDLGSAGWSLSGGARIVADGNPYRSGSNSVSLPSGSSATSPTVCVKALDPATRFFVRNTGSSGASLRVDITYKTLLGLLPVTGTLGYVTAGGAWQPSPKYGHVLANLLGTLGLNKGLSASFRYKFTPRGYGSGFQVDDLLVDPLLTI